MQVSITYDNWSEYNVELTLTEEQFLDALDREKERPGWTVYDHDLDAPDPESRWIVWEMRGSPWHMVGVRHGALNVVGYCKYEDLDYTKPITKLGLDDILEVASIVRSFLGIRK